MSFTSKIEPEKLETLNKKVWENGRVDREHILGILEIIPTNDGHQIVEEVKNWLTDLHNNPNFSKVIFPKGDIDAIVSDLDSYGRVQPETILKFKQENSKTVPVS